MSRARPPQCGAPDLSTFKSATSADEQRAMHAEPEAAKRAAAAAGLLYPPASGRGFSPNHVEPEASDPQPNRPDAKDPGPDLSSFQEWAPASSEKERRSVADEGGGGMRRSALSIGSQASLGTLKQDFN